MMKNKTLKERIVEKFGSVRAFAFHDKQPLPAWTVIRVLNGDKKRHVDFLTNKIEESLEKLKPSNKYITDGQRELIRRTILIEFGSFAEFVRKYPDYSKTFVSNIVKGRKKKFDESAKAFFKIVFDIHSRSDKKLIK